MINQQDLDEIVYQELKAFNLSIGWIDPDTCDSYDDFESNDYLLHFKMSDMFHTRIEKDTCLDDKSIDLWQSIVLYVEEHEPYEDWVNFSHEFKLPSLMCLDNTESFTKAFKDAVVLSYKNMKLERIRCKLSYVKSLSDKELSLMDSAKSVCIKFDIQYGEAVIMSINK